MKTREITVKGSAGRPVRATLHEGAPGAGTVVVAPGFKGFRAWGFFPFLCERLAASGPAALRLDFSHNGVEERDFDRLDLFLLDTWTRHQEDLDAVVQSLGEEPIGMLGHSRGGADVVLFAARSPRVRACCTLAAVADTTRAPPDLEERLRTLGYYPIENARTGQIMPVARSQWEDAHRHDVLASARALSRRPLLVVHGSADEAVPIEDAHALAAAHGNAELCLVEGAGHTFGAVHPWQGPGPALEEACARIVGFFGRELGR